MRFVEAGGVWFVQDWFGGLRQGRAGVVRRGLRRRGQAVCVMVGQARLVKVCRVGARWVVAGTVGQGTVRNVWVRSGMVWQARSGMSRRVGVSPGVAGVASSGATRCGGAWLVRVRCGRHGLVSHVPLRCCKASPGRRVKASPGMARCRRAVMCWFGSVWLSWRVKFG